MVKDQTFNQTHVHIEFVAHMHYFHHKKVNWFITLAESRLAKSLGPGCAELASLPSSMLCPQPLPGHGRRQIRIHGDIFEYGWCHRHPNWSCFQMKCLIGLLLLVAIMFISSGPAAAPGCGVGTSNYWWPSCSSVVALVLELLHLVVALTAVTSMDIKCSFVPSVVYTEGHKFHI